MLVDMKVVYVFNMCENIKVLCVGSRQQCGWQRQPVGEDHDVSLIVMVLLLLPAGVILLLCHLDAVMNLGVVTHIEAVKHSNVLTISTVYHTPTPIKVHLN